MATIASVSPTELIRSTWGNSVATELNGNTVKVDGSQPMTGSLVATASPGIKLRASDNNPYLAFESTTGTRYSYIQTTGTTTLKYNVDSVSGTHSFHIAEAQKLYVNATDTVVTNNFTATGTSTFHNGLTIGSNGQQLALVDTSTAGSDFYDTHIGFYGGGVSMVSPGPRSGYVGFPGNSTLTMMNEVSGGAVQVRSGTGPVYMTGASVVLDPSGSTIFNGSGVEYGRHTGAQFLWGKTTGNSGGTTGIDLDVNGRIMVSTTNNAYTCMYLRRLADGEGNAYIQFLGSGTGILAHISQDTIAPAGVYATNFTVSAPSDYRLKDELGPVPDALERVMQLAPKHLRWKEGGDPFDGFIAHEVADVVPKAVRGMKDATYTADEAEMMGAEPGDIKPQQLSESALIPLLTAGLQELAQRVEALEAG